MASSRKCICSWLECSTFHQNILLHAPQQHPWNTGIIALQLGSEDETKTALKRNSLRRAIARYLLCDKPIFGLKTLHLHAHHFPQALLVWRSDTKATSWVNFLTKDQVDKIVRLDEGQIRMREVTNSILFHDLDFFKKKQN